MDTNVTLDSFRSAVISTVLFESQKNDGSGERGGILAADVLYTDLRSCSNLRDLLASLNFCLLPSAN